MVIRDTIKLGLRQLTDDELSAQITEHILKMNGNASFATPTPSVTEFAASTEPFTSTVTQIHDLDLQRIELCNARDEQRSAAEQALALRAAYVQHASGGAGDVILTSGFSLAKPKGGTHATPATPIAATTLALTEGDNVGTIQAMWKPERGSTWIIQACADPLVEANFHQVGVTNRSSFDITGLTSGTKYWVRIAAVKGGIQGDWSAPVLCRAP